MAFEKSEIANLDAKVIASLNALTILYNSCSVAPKGVYVRLPSLCCSGNGRILRFGEDGRPGQQ